LPAGLVRLQFFNVNEALSVIDRAKLS